MAVYSAAMDNEYEGTAIRVRYTWSGITATSAHWTQAFSPDGA
jgi:short-subunit dehydrogenase